MTEKSSLEQRFRAIEENAKRLEGMLSDAVIRAGRNRADVRVMAVTKTVEPALVNYALQTGFDLIGENKVQELLSKLDYLHPQDVEKHIIGHLQSNKVRKIIDVVQMIQSVDSVSLAQEISRQAQLHQKEMSVLLEVNIGNEASKTGFQAAQLPEAAACISEMPGIKIRGLMCIPPVCETEKAARGYFAQTRSLFETLRSAQGTRDMDTLSMGMSADYVSAVLEGATLIRIGGALFGARQY
ncbi:MAG: YggS family pyridoxal phosphate-dependent enzyme [Clostridia bacterium]|nr:YggS family pyridoxal phosphate-dependent enzyme [Clostridia bacterium]